MNVLAFDPGYAVLGYALVTGQRPEVSLFGRFEFSQKQRAAEKLSTICRAAGSLFIDPDLLIAGSDPTVAVEQSWQGARNWQTAGVLGELCGALLAVASERKLPTIRLDPRTWQSASGIPMRANRQTVKARSLEIASIRAGQKITCEDEADAICMAWVAHGMLRMRRAA